MSPITTVPPDVSAYFQAATPHATRELALHEKLAATLRSLRFEDAASRQATAVALRAIQAQFASLAMAIRSVRTPARLTGANEARAKSNHEMSSAAAELANALDGDAGGRAKRIETARLRAEAAEVSSRSSAASISAALGVAAALVATIPVMGQIIAAVLAAIAAVVILIGQILAKAKEQEAKAKEDENEPEPKRKDDDRP